MCDSLHNKICRVKDCPGDIVGPKHCDIGPGGCSTLTKISRADVSSYLVTIMEVCLFCGAATSMVMLYSLVS